MLPPLVLLVLPALAEVCPGLLAEDELLELLLELLLDGMEGDEREPCDDELGMLGELDCEEDCDEDGMDGIDDELLGLLLELLGMDGDDDEDEDDDELGILGILDWLDCCCCEDSQAASNNAMALMLISCFTITVFISSSQ